MDLVQRVRQLQGVGDGDAHEASADAAGGAQVDAQEADGADL